MKNLIILLTVIGFLFTGCQNSNSFNPVSPNPGPSHSDAIIADSTTTINVPVMEYTILVNGNKGGKFYFSPTYINGDDSITASISLFFPDSTSPAFEGTKIFKVVIDMEHASMQFIDLTSADGHITFNNKVLLSAEFNGINPSNLGLLPNLPVDFVYIADDGSIEIIKNNGVKFLNLGNHSRISVKGATIWHFSRYVWAT